MSAAADTTTYNATFISLTENALWNKADNWQDGYIGGTNATANDRIDLAYPFYTSSPATSYGSAIDLGTLGPSFHSLTGATMQVITRTGENSGKTLSVVDPTDFFGVWAQGGVDVSTLSVTPDSSLSRTPTFQRVANGLEENIKVESGDKARVRDLIGTGNLNVNGDGELELESPRNLDARAVLFDAGTLTVNAEASEEPAPAAGAVWHFDAADETTMEKRTDGDVTYVDRWHDADGGAAVAYPPAAATPFLSSETYNGHHLVDFGGFLTGGSYSPSDAQTRFGTAAYMYVGNTNETSLSPSWNNKRNVREMFVVMRTHAVNTSSTAFITPLGHHSDYYLAGKMSANTMFNEQYSVCGWNPMGRGNIRIWLDGAPYLNSTLKATALGGQTVWSPTNLHVIAVRFDEGSLPAITALGTTRGYTTEYGGLQIGEALIYATPLDEAARRETIDYLKRKWLAGTLAKPYDLGAVVVANNSAKINVEEGDTLKIRTARLAQNVASTAKIVKTGAGTLELDEVSPTSAEIEVQGGALMLAHDTPVAATDEAGVPTDGMLCWIDVANSTYDGSAEGVTKIYDRRADKAATVYAESLVKSGSTLPTLTAESTSGLTMLDYGSAVGTTYPYSRIRVNGSNLSGVREGFVVWRKHASSGAPGVIGAGDRRSIRNGNGQLIEPGWCYACARGMNWAVDGQPIDSSSGTINDFTSVGVSKNAVVNFSSMDTVPHCYLALHGWASSGEGGGCSIGEVICYSRRLSDAERRNVTAYLMNKWESGAKLPLDTDDTVDKVTFADGVAPTLGTRTDRTVSTLSGEGTLKKLGAGKLTVSSLGSSITNLDVAAGTFKTVTDWMGDAWLHLDASVASSFTYKDSQSGEGAEILSWNDVRGNGSCAKSIATDTSSYGYYAQLPVYSTQTVSGLSEGKPYVDFGSIASKSDSNVRGAGMFFYDASGAQVNPGDIAEFHLVFTFKKGNVAALGSKNNNTAGLTPANSSNGGYLGSNVNAKDASKRSNGGDWYTGNHFTNPAGTCTDQFIVFSQVGTAGNVNAWALGVDRNCGIGGVRLAEVLIFRGATNTIEKSNAIHDYLYKKWQGKGEGASMPTFHDVNIAGGATAELSNLSGGAVAFDTLTGTGTLKAESVSGVSSLGGVTLAGGLAPADGFTLNVALSDTGCDCLNVAGTFTAPASVTVNVNVADDYRGADTYPILTYGSLSGAIDLSNWTLNVSGTTRRKFSLYKGSDGVYLNVSKDGMAILFR